MNCLKCGSDTAVVDSRKGDGGSVTRRRKCVSCGFRFTTNETAVIKKIEKPKERPLKKTDKPVEKRLPKKVRKAPVVVQKPRHYDDYVEEDVSHYVDYSSEREWE